MESVYHTKTGKYFDISDDDFEKFQEIFSQYEPMSEGEGLDCVKGCEDTSFSREYTDDEIKSIFWLDAEYSGTDKEMAKENVVHYSERRKAMDEIEDFIKNKKHISTESAKTILKVMEAFESYECEIN